MMTLAICCFAGLLSIAYWTCIELDLICNSRADISCRCGRCTMRDVIIVDEIDVQRHAEALTEGCEYCRLSAARDAGTKGRRDEGASPLAKGGLRVVERT